MDITIAAISGSLRAESYNTKLLRAFLKVAPKGVTVKLIDIANLPFINEDLEMALPEAVRKFHETVMPVDAVLLATPEYNRSYSPAIKNALDWGPRPHGVNVWDGKPVGIVGCTPYSLGAFGAQHHLRQVVSHLNMQPLQQPEFYLERVGEKFDAEGNVIDPKTQEKITQYWSAFVALIQKHK